MTLAEKAAAAKALGMSYGQYVAKYHPESTGSKMTPGSDDRLFCVVCGAELQGQQKKYCSRACENTIRSRRKKAKRAGSVREVRRTKVGKTKRVPG